ncbi:pilus assembly protein CpaC [Sphingomonas laterariae]|uniref:Pilus assembly protein CpaC n=1 Tax=Edaphosphingomonas laterariae TaxID=861865 RepID=A0A239I727_9SPHN|nr:type II and III secretion system protein family protein [Sphingomonas laterariae]SNS89400.1 pilus assembly protein CpaC [Sphingomonas laterariae]
MRITRNSHHALGLALAALLAAGFAAADPAPVAAAPAATAPSDRVTLSVGTGQMVRLNGAMSDLFVANDAIADVQVRSPTQLYIFGKGAGETTVYATNKAGQVVYSANVRVGANFSNVGQMLRVAMPDAQISATPMNGAVLLTGTVATPGDVEEAQQLVQAFVGSGTQVFSRLKTATPMQVNLQVRIAEVSRDFSKSLGFNLLSRDTSGGFLFGIGQGNAGTISGPAGSPNYQFNFNQTGTTLGAAGHLLGMDLLATLDLAENDGFVTTLANPNLTALSGETASFLAGGEVPIPISQALGTLSVEYKQYGVSLAFTPTVLADGRISLRVRPEVSQLSTAGSVTLNDFNIPGFITRRAETTVELGSGQAFMIGGLLSNNQNNVIDKAPFLGDLPILGMLFKSTKYQRRETELVIIVTPYLVKPVSANQVRLPTDGYKAPTDAETFLMGQSFSGQTGGRRPVPTAAPPVTMAPSGTPAASVAPAAPAGTKGALPAPGFSFN